MMKTPPIAEINSRIRHLRATFCSGCTAMQLMRDLRKIAPEGSRWQLFISDSLHEAFGVTVVTPPDRYESLLENPKMQSRFIKILTEAALSLARLKSHHFHFTIYTWLALGSRMSQYK